MIVLETRKRYRTQYFAINLILSLLCFFMFIVVIKQTWELKHLVFFFILISFLCAPLGVYFGISAVEILYGRVIIDDQKIYTRSLIHFNKGIERLDVKGLSVTDAGLVVESKTNQSKRIVIPIHFEVPEQFFDWIWKYINIEFGGFEPFGYEVERLPEAEREMQHEQALRAVKISKWAGIMSTIWILFWPHPYQMAVAMATLVPLCTIVVYKYFRDWTYLFEKKYESSHDVTAGLLLPAFGLFIRALIDYDLADYQLLLWQLSGLVLILVTFICYQNPELNVYITKKSMHYVVVLFFTIVYGLGSLVCVNGAFVKATPKISTAVIVGKGLSLDKPTVHYLYLASWGAEHQDTRVRVRNFFYDSLIVGDSIRVYDYKGYLGYPWIEAHKFVPTPKE